jgi:hypothetical protein
LPTAVLAAVVIVATRSLLSFHDLPSLFRASLPEVSDRLADE